MRNAAGARPIAIAAAFERRHLTKGQQAMALALIYPEPEKGGRGKRAANSKETLGFSSMRLSQARAVLRHSRALALSVFAGTISLDTNPLKSPILWGIDP